MLSFNEVTTENAVVHRLRDINISVNPTSSKTGFQCQVSVLFQNKPSGGEFGSDKICLRSNAWAGFH